VTTILRAEQLIAGGDALAREEGGRVVFVRGALPGERVAVDYVLEKKDFARAVTVDVVEASADRRDVPCRHRREGCGGCGWMHLQPEAQLAAKAEIVRESLRRVGRIDADRVAELVTVGAAVAPIGYRTTIRVAGAADGRPGFRAEGSDEVVPIVECRTAHPRLPALLGETTISGDVELTLRTSVATGEMTAWWPGGGTGSISGLPTSVHIGEKAWLEERVSGRLLRVSARSFFQSGPQAAELLVESVGRAAGDSAAGRTVDAYGGVGLFAATVLADARHVTVVESAAGACRDAEHNLTGRSARVVKREFGRFEAGGEHEDLVIADPARSGLGRPGVASIGAAHPDVVVLVSCDPVSLARDSMLMTEHGYSLESVEVLDLFPETHHVETVARFGAAR
jgi:23S rRNA (uracil1939-C5)-methyltransferase